jgi:glyoxylase-like metal-dependent hydrolase (beta-lactamase superfamily II)
MHQVECSEHFCIEFLADGVYAAIATPEGAAYSNAGIIDLGNRTLVVDSFDTVVAAEDLRDAAESLTGRPADAVIITHQHGDHWGGTQAFAGTPILCTEAARRSIAAEAADLPRLIQDPSELREHLAGLQAQLAEQASVGSSSEEPALAALRKQIRWTERTLEALPTLHPAVPTMTFQRKVTFHGSARIAELVVPGHARTPYPAHTPGDCYLLLPEEKTTFTGDLAFFARQPYMGSADASGWSSVLRDLLASDHEVMVPGHGPVGGKAELEHEREYLIWIDGWVKEGVAAGRPVEELLAEPLPQRFADLAADGLPSEPNVRALYGAHGG